MISMKRLRKRKEIDYESFGRRKIYNFYELQEKYEERNEFRIVCYVVVRLRKERSLREVLKSSLGKGVKVRTKKRIYVTLERVIDITIAVMMAKRTHLFPFRTQKLSSFTPKVLAVNRREDR